MDHGLARRIMDGCPEEVCSERGGVVQLGQGLGSAKPWTCWVTLQAGEDGVEV
jgi:hypothetical protein